jgi:hypothetical protein
MSGPEVVVTRATGKGMGARWHGQTSGAELSGRVEMVETLAGGSVGVAGPITSRDGGCGGTGDEGDEMVGVGAGDPMSQVAGQPKVHPELPTTFWVHCPSSGCTASRPRS